MTSTEQASNEPILIASDALIRAIRAKQTLLLQGSPCIFPLHFHHLVRGNLKRLLHFALCESPLLGEPLREQSCMLAAEDAMCRDELVAKFNA